MTLAYEWRDVDRARAADPSEQEAGDDGLFLARERDDRRERVVFGKIKNGGPQGEQFPLDQGAGAPGQRAGRAPRQRAPRTLEPPETADLR